ncbi:MAG: hypothetical protein V8Q36_06765 [Anaerotignum sp.]
MERQRQTRGHCLQKANDTMAQVTSMSAQMEVQMDMAYEEESMKLW